MVMGSGSATQPICAFRFPLPTSRDMLMSLQPQLLNRLLRHDEDAPKYIKIQGQALEP